MRFLVAYGSERHGTEELAAMIGDAVRAHGHRADVVAARLCSAVQIAAADAVIIGGSLYEGRWHHDARKLVRTHAAVLRMRPVWLFASGPLDASATQHLIAPVKHVAAAMKAVGARGEVTFGGRLAPDAHGLLAHAMAKTRAGDWRDPAHVERFVTDILAALTDASVASSPA